MLTPYDNAVIGSEATDIADEIRTILDNDLARMNHPAYLERLDGLLQRTQQFNAYIDKHSVRGRRRNVLPRQVERMADCFDKLTKYAKGLTNKHVCNGNRFAMHNTKFIFDIFRLIEEATVARDIDYDLEDFEYDDSMTGQAVAETLVSMYFDENEALDFFEVHGIRVSHLRVVIKNAEHTEFNGEYIVHIKPMITVVSKNELG